MWLPPHFNRDNANNDTLFLLLAWWELFDDFTPDMLQPRLFHLPALASELGTIASWATKNPRWEKHLDGIRAEISAAVVSETSLLDRLPAYRWSLCRLTKISSAAETEIFARTLEASLSEYEEAAFAAFRIAAHELPKGKAKALEAIGRMATICIQRGRASSECLAFITEPRLRITPDLFAEELIRFCRPVPMAYICYFSIRGDSRSIQQIVRKAGFTLVGAAQFFDRTGVSVDDGTGVYIDAEASIPHEAARKTTLSLRRAIDVFNFYRNEVSLALGDKCVVTDKNGTRTEIRVGGLALRRLHPRNAAASDTQEVLGAATSIRRMDRLLNALDLKEAR